LTIRHHQPILWKRERGKVGMESLKVTQPDNGRTRLFTSNPLFPTEPSTLDQGLHPFLCCPGLVCLQFSSHPREESEWQCLKCLGVRSPHTHPLALALYASNAATLRPWVCH
jgi:hypothetical protein